MSTFAKNVEIQEIFIDLVKDISINSISPSKFCKFSHCLGDFSKNDIITSDEDL